MLLNWIGDWRTNKPFVRHAVKTTFAACLSYAIAAYFDLPQSFWAAVVAIFVTQANVGASLGQAFYWFLGSLLGVVVGGAVAIVVGSEPAMRLLGLAPTVLVLGYFAARRPPLRIACVNAAIVILGTPMFAAPIYSAGIRMIEVVIGTVVALLTVLFIFPSRAGPALASHIARTLPVYFQMLSEVLTSALTGRCDDDVLSASNANIRAAVTMNQALKEETLREVEGFLAGQVDPEPLLNALRRFWHTELMLARACSSPLPAPAMVTLRPTLHELRDAVDEAVVTLNDAGDRTIMCPPSLAAVEEALEELSRLISEMRQKGELRSMSMDDVVRLLALDFAVEQLRLNIGDLADRLQDLTCIAGTAAWQTRKPSPLLPARSQRKPAPSESKT
ncbi:MAG: FUSC family protein [Hyphomicrobium sp.]